MSIRRYTADFEPIAPELLAAWREIPTAVIGDCLNRERCMAAAVKPISWGMRFAAQARTVITMAGDSSPIHAALPFVQPGQMLAVDAAGVTEVAVWGGIMTAAARQRGVAAVVIDGAIRDVAEIRATGLPLYCRAVTPRGPHKGNGGTVDAPAAVGGVAVLPGDLVVGDDDGVVVVPLSSHTEVFAAARQRLAREREWLLGIAAGSTTVELLGLAEAEIVKP